MAPSPHFRFGGALGRWTDTLVLFNGFSFVSMLFVIPFYFTSLYSGNSYVTLQLELCPVGS